MSELRWLIRLISVYLRAERVQKLSVVVLNMIYACVVYDVISCSFPVFINIAVLLLISSHLVSSELVCLFQTLSVVH